VQTYPAVEYDFVPTRLVAREGDYVHFQWIGFDNNPNNGNNNAEGTEGTDRNNVCQLSNAASNQCMCDSEACYAQTDVPKLFESVYHRQVTTDERFAFFGFVVDHRVPLFSLLSIVVFLLWPRFGEGLRLVRGAPGSSQQQPRRHRRRKLVVVVVVVVVVVAAFLCSLSSLLM
jgi:hypothetical protein